MTDYKNYVNTLLEYIQNIRDTEFKLNNYIPPININKQPKKFFTSRNTQDIRFVQQNIYKSKKTKELKAKIRKNNKNNDIKNKDIKIIEEIEKDKLDENADILTDKNIFNVIQNEDDLVKWKDLDFEVKKSKINEYIGKYYKDLSETVLNRIFELIEKNKINFKKYICYNKLTKNIDDMPIINNIDGYSLNYTTVKKKKRKKITF
jgi:hypothetical protein